MNVIILGAGLVGGPMALDLAKDADKKVTSVDVNAGVLAALKQRSGGKIETIQADLADSSKVGGLVKDFDMVINAVPGFMGYQTLQAIIEAEKDVIDIAFFPEDPFGLDELAKKHNVTAIVDCGVAPGMSNMLTGHVHRILDKTENVLIYVGGLPKVRLWPYEYKAVFSPIDVIEEYTRPARYVENKVVVTREALSDVELLNFPEVGTLEAFNSDGLRSLIDTIDGVNMKEKTMRYPGHVEKMLVMRETGFFSKEEIDIKGVKISPLDFTAKIMFPNWKMEEGEEDVTVMRIIVEGLKDGKPLRYTYDLLDRFDTVEKIPSMSRTTGYTATVALRMVAEGVFTDKGVFPPELVGKKQDAVEYMLAGLKERNIIYKETIE